MTTNKSSTEYQYNILIDILSEMVTSYLAKNKNISVDKGELQSDESGVNK